jgi:hypothetical protein
MITQEQFKERWKYSPLVTVDISRIGHVSLPAESLDFLVKAGLPAHSGIANIGFKTLAENLPLFSFEDNGMDPPGEGEYYFIGGDESTDTQIVVHSTDGRVVMVHFPDIFTLNSSIPQMAECLLAYHERFADPKKAKGPSFPTDHGPTMYAI